MRKDIRSSTSPIALAAPFPPHDTTLAVWKVLLRFGHIRLQISAALSGWCRIHVLS